MVHMLIVYRVFCPVDMGSQTQLIHINGIVCFYDQTRPSLSY